MLSYLRAKKQQHQGDIKKVIKNLPVGGALSREKDS